MKSTKKIDQPFHEIRLLDTVIRVPMVVDNHFSLAKTKGEPRSIENLKIIHHHLYYEFFFVLDGELSIVTEEGTITYTSSVVVLPPYYNHYSFFTGGLGFAIGAYIPEEKHSLPLFSKLLENEPIVFPLANKQVKDDFSFYLKKLDQIKRDSDVGASKCNALIRLIFIEMNDLFAVGNSRLHDRSGEGVIKYIEDIDQFISSRSEERNVRIGELATLLNLSEKQTSRIIHKQYGCTFSQLINERRLDKACMFLKNTDLSIGEIVERLNLGGENYFYALFKKKFGVTPTQYRKSKKE